MKQPPYPAPDFTLPGTGDKPVSLADQAGKWLILYFYPKDETAGCTVEACSLRDARDTLSNMGAEIIGISKDSPTSHEKFHANHQLNFELLSDPDGKVIETYGAWGKKMFGMEGILRKTFVINPEGQVVKVYSRVTPLGHGEQIVADLKALQATTS